MNSFDKPTLEYVFNDAFRVDCVCFSQHKSRICSVGDERVVVWNPIERRKEFEIFVSETTFTSCDYSPTENLIVTGSINKRIWFWNPNGNSEVDQENQIEGHSNCVRSVRFSHDGNGLFSASYDETIKVWNIERKKCVLSLNCESGYVLGIDVLPDDRTLISGHGDLYESSKRASRLWDLRMEKKCIHTFEHTGNQLTAGNVYTVQFHPNSYQFASGCDEGHVKYFDIRTRKLLQDYGDHRFGVRSVCFHPSHGNYLISGSSDETIKIFDLLEKKNIFTSHEHDDSVTSVQFSASGSYFVSGSRDQKVGLWKSNLFRHDEVSQSRLDLEERIKVLRNAEAFQLEFFVVRSKEFRIFVPIIFTSLH